MTTLLVAGIALAQLAPPEELAFSTHQDGVCGHCGRAKTAALRTAAGMLGLGPQDFADDPVGGGGPDLEGPTDVLHNKLDLELVPSTQTIIGSNEMTVLSLTNGLSEFTFRLRSQYVITSATCNGVPITITNVSTTTRRATLDKAYNAGEQFVLAIAYNGVASSKGYGSIEFTSQGGQPLIYTLSEPYYAYTWWPCKDADVGEAGDNSDKFTLEMAVTVPDTLVVASNGVLQGVDPLPGAKRYRWKSDYPIVTYLVSFAATNYNTWSKSFNYGGGSMPVEFFIYPGSDTPGNRAAWELCIPMLGTFSEVYGLYPFINEKYGICQFGFSGGMEHQTITGQGGFGQSLTAHELAHQWWGDAVTCKTWHDIWLNEGFATYSEAIWEEKKPGSTGLPALFAAMDARRPSQVSGTVYRYDTSSINAIFSSNYAYRKGGWVLHQLRKVVGDAKFFEILAAYRAAYEGSAATTDDLLAVAESVSGMELDWFFDEWVYNGGAPAYASGWQTVNINGQDYLRLRLRQSQVGTYPVFTMPVDVRVNYSGGSQTVTIWNDAATEHFVVPINAPATGVVVDENNWILATGKTSEAYVNGPPKVVQASPAPGAVIPASSAPSNLSVTFSEDVTLAPVSFTVVSSGGSVPFTFAYSPVNFTATLEFGAALAAGEYTVTVHDAIVSAAASIPLDGELGAPAKLPSGEGLPGGNAVYTFKIGVLGDVNGDGKVDQQDLGALLGAFGTCVGQPGYLAAADFDNSGCIDQADLGVLLSNWTG